MGEDPAPTRLYRFGAYAIVLVGLLGLLGLVGGLWPATRPYVVALALSIAGLRLGYVLLQGLRAYRAGSGPPRAAVGTRWYRIHPTFGLRAVGGQPRDWPVPDQVLGADWLALDDEARAEITRVFFTELLWWLARDGLRYTLTTDDGGAERGVLTAAALRSLVAAEPRALHLTRARTSLLVVGASWTGANVALTTAQRQQLVRVMSRAGFDVRPDADAPAEPDEVQLVVGAAVIRDGRVLSAQRSEPPALAGLWEFPGGKVEPGETEHDALVRECAEELGLRLQVHDRVGPEVAVGDGRYLLRVWAASVLEGEIRLSDHSAVRWLSEDELGDVEWIPADAPIVAALPPLLHRVD